MRLGDGWGGVEGMMHACVGEKSGAGSGVYV